jgi:hypothetical protein
VCGASPVMPSTMRRYVIDSTRHRNGVRSFCKFIAIVSFCVSVFFECFECIFNVLIFDIILSTCSELEKNIFVISDEQSCQQ